MTLNKNLKMTSNNSNLNMTIKNNNNNNNNSNNNNDKLIQQKLKNNKINKKIIHKKKILHDKKASMTNKSTFDCKKTGLVYDKKNALDKAFSPKLNLTSRTKDNSSLKKEICPKQINKKVIKIDSCSVPGYSAPGVSKINQDNYFIIKEFMNNTEQFFMGICDGHGSFGHLISEYICNTLPPKIKIISNENIKKAFLSTNKSLIEESKIDCSLSGSTCSSLIIFQDKLISANVGDSRAVLARYENGQYNAINLTRDHKPTEPDEMKRILNNGGRIKQFTEPRTGNSIGPERIWLKNSEIPGLAMSRSLGDNLAHTVGVSAEPEIQKFEFNGTEKFILLASDGIWEFIDSDESVRIIKDFYEKDMDAVGALSALVKEAFKRWKSEEDNIDDITAILIFFE
jgi:serine/threonine protein phosphatase PrpC